MASMAEVRYTSRNTDEYDTSHERSSHFRCLRRIHASCGKIESALHAKLAIVVGRRLSRRALAIIKTFGHHVQTPTLL